MIFTFFSYKNINLRLVECNSIKNHFLLKCYFSYREKFLDYIIVVRQTTMCYFISKNFGKKVDHQILLGKFSYYR